MLFRSIAIIIKLIARIAFANAISLDLLNRSSNTPAYGPTNEYGSNTTLNATAAATAFGWRSGENKTKEASPDWKSPSIN